MIDWYFLFYHSTLCDFETGVLRMVRVYQEWLRYAVCNKSFDLAFHDFAKQQVIKRSILVAYFRDSGKWNFIFVIHDLFIFSLVNPSLYNPLLKQWTFQASQKLEPKLFGTLNQLNTEILLRVFELPYLWWKTFFFPWKLEKPGISLLVVYTVLTECWKITLVIRVILLNCIAHPCCV